MHNRVTNLFNEAGSQHHAADRSWQFDRQPGLRLCWLFVLMFVPLSVVSARLIYVQAFLTESFTDRLDWTTETNEAIPSRDGRILSADGTVLAYDSVHFDVWMHYRWLEEPADPLWLKRQSLAKLDRRQRRVRAHVEQGQQAALAERQEMWLQLAELTEISNAQLAKQRMRIQRRIEKMVDRVIERKNLKRKQAAKLPEQNLPEGTPLWKKAWHAVETTLTTPPVRGHHDPIVLAEEHEYYKVIENVPAQVAAEIESFPHQYPGLIIRTSTRRVYPQKSLAAHVIGSRTHFEADEWKLRREHFPDGDPFDYQPGDRIGRNGVERSYDRHLRGLRGQRRTVKNKRGEIIRTEIVREPRTGHDVVLTLNMPLQRQMETILEQTLARPIRPQESEVADNIAADGTESAGGAIVVLDIHTGAVAAAVSWPQYDLGLLTGENRDAWRKVANDRRHPFIPRVTRMTLPPGSVFKTLTAVALLESGLIDPDEPYTCHGYLGNNPHRFRCYIYSHYGVGHGATTLSDAICRSCNVYFFHAADKIGPDKLVDWAQRFGFGRSSGIDLPGERGGNLPLSPSQAGDAHRRKPWYAGDTRGLAIGQAQLTVTPIQIARMMAAIANDGYLVTPHIVRSAGPTHPSDTSSAIGSGRSGHRIPGLSDGTLARVREGLERVVAHPRGTGYKRVRLDEIAIAGKTGTAEVGPGKRDHAWFAGYVPADQPKYAFAVVLEHAGSGGKNAGPIARQLVQAMLEHGLLRPTEMTAESQDPELGVRSPCH